MTDLLAAMFDDPEDDPLEDENVAQGLGWHRDDNTPVEGTDAYDDHAAYWRRRNR